MSVARPKTVMITAIGAALALGGCSSEHSVLHPSSPEAGSVATLGWALIITASVVTAGVFALLVYGLVRRQRAQDDDERSGVRWLLGGGVILPVVVILPLIGFSVSIIDQPEDGVLHVDVTGHQYWWEYGYREGGFETANELHIPVGQKVELTLRSDDVVHSFWVPELAGKHDLVPGHENTMILQADHAGTYKGQCAEFCGIQHAKMRLLVIAQDEADYTAWVEQQQATAQGDTGSDGAHLFASQGCAGCHTVRGTEAQGRLGPDLTHIASRRTLGAVTIDNTPENMRRWIGHTWDVKDHIVMPELPLTDAQVEAIAAYLETLE